MKRRGKIKILRTSDPHFEKLFREFLLRRESTGSKVESLVHAILKEVKEQGDKAVFKYTKKYDQVKLDVHSVKVTQEEIESAYTHLSLSEKDALTVAAERIRKYHQGQMDYVTGKRDGASNVFQVVRPLMRTGLYIPGGKAVYPSSVLMSAIPARVAGVKEVIMVSPTVSTHVLAAARIAGVDCIYRIGGAQAIAALAYGTKSIPKVDKIVGPGNVYVETAKRAVYGEVGLDMVAGPSEVLIVADKSGIPSFAAADLLAQAEHDEDALPMLIALNETFINEVQKELFSQLRKLRRKEIAGSSIGNNALMILVSDVGEAIELTNRIASEHLVLMVEKPDELLKDITCAGAVFLGNYSPVAVGDYLAGPSHILPTGGTARFFSPLGVEDFIKRMSVISFTKQELGELETPVKILALLEGFDAHARAVEGRVHSSE